MTNNLRLTFIDNDQDSYSLDLNKEEFVQICKVSQINYFTTMLSSYKESTMDEITIQVPFASVMTSIMNSMINGNELKSSSPMEIIKLMYSLDFLGMDVLEIFQQLFVMQIDDDVFELVYEFIDNKSYNHDSYVRFLATKMPPDYSFGRFSIELLQRMIELGKQNIIILHNTQYVQFYYVNNDRYRQLANKYNDEIISVRLNPIKPIVAVLSTWHLILYDVFTGDILHEIDRHDDCGYIMQVCFSSDGANLYVCRSEAVQFYDTISYKKTDTMRLRNTAIRMECSPTGKYVAYIYYEDKVFYGYASGFPDLCILNLEKNNWYRNKLACHKPGPIFQFVSDSLLTFYSAENNDKEYVNGYCCDTYSDCTEHLGYVYKIQKHIFEEHMIKICHPARNMLICYKPPRNKKDGYDTLIYRKTNYLSSQSLTPADNNIIHHTCFSHNGVHLYTVVANIYESSIVKHKLHDNGTVTLKWSRPMGTNRMACVNGICSGSYVNSRFTLYQSKSS